MLDSLREVANQSARTAKVANFWRQFRKTLAFRVPPTVLLFLGSGVLLFLGANGDAIYRALAGSCFSLGVIALLNVVYFIVTSLLERPEPVAAVDNTPTTTDPSSPPAGRHSDLQIEFTNCACRCAICVAMV